MKKIIIVGCVLVVLLVIGFLVYKQKNVENNNDEINNMSGDVEGAKKEIEKIFNDIKAGKSNWDDLAKFYDGWYGKLAGAKDFKFYKSFDHGDKTSIYTYGIMPGETYGDIPFPEQVMFLYDLAQKKDGVWKVENGASITFDKPDGDQLIFKLDELVSEYEKR